MQNVQQQYICIFNLIGTVIFMTVFYLINAVVGFSFFHQAATPAGIAVIHSVFNVTATIILLPFAKGLEKLACLTIRDKKRMLLFRQRTENL